MIGRQEHTLAIENEIKEKICNVNPLVQEYYYSLVRETPTTKRAYIGYILEFVDYYSDRDLSQLTKFDIDKYMDHIRYRVVNGIIKENGESIRATKLYAIKSFYNFMIDNGYVISNPCDKVKPPRSNVDKEVVAMTMDEIGILKNNIKTGVGSDRAIKRQEQWKNRDLAIISIGCQTGLRVTAISEINISDIDFENNKITVTDKENHTKEVLIGENTKKIILDWIDDRTDLMYGYPENDALFISNQRKRITTKAISLLLNKYTKGINKHISPHKMRSSCATNIYEQTGDIYIVQQTLGHKNIQNTMRYTKVSEAKLRSAINIMD